MELEDLNKIISKSDLFTGIENYINFFIDTSPKIVNRKIRFNYKGGKFKYRKGLSYNQLHDFMIPPNLLLKPLIRILKSEKN